MRWLAAIARWLLEIFAPPPDLGFVREHDRDWVFNRHYYPILAPRIYVTAKVLDKRYRIADKAHFANLVQKWSKTKKPYSEELGDCEDQAFRFAVFSWEHGLNQVAIVIDEGTGHSYNLVIWPDGTIDSFEPQSSTWVHLGQGLYKLEKGLVLV